LSREIIEAKRKDGMSATYIADLKKRLARFCADFGERSIAGVTVEELDNWLRALPGSPRSQANYRANVGLLFSYATRVAGCSIAIQSCTPRVRNYQTIHQSFSRSMNLRLGNLSTFPPLPRQAAFWAHLD
jgi:hypothetical protein